MSLPLKQSELESPWILKQPRISTTKGLKFVFILLYEAISYTAFRSSVSNPSQRGKIALTRSAEPKAQLYSAFIFPKKEKKASCLTSASPILKHAQHFMFHLFFHFLPEQVTFSNRAMRRSYSDEEICYKKGQKYNYFKVLDQDLSESVI